MTQSTPCKSCDSCHRETTCCLATWPATYKASWSQLDPGKVMTPNFIAAARWWRSPRFIVSRPASAARRLEAEDNAGHGQHVVLPAAKRSRGYIAERIPRV